MKNEAVTVFTCVVGKRDSLREDQFPCTARYVAFVDAPRLSATWSQLPVPLLFASYRRNSRQPKILAHQYVESGYSLWLDAAVALRAPVESLIEDWLRDADLALFCHESRACTYDEAEECQRRELDDPTIIEHQAATYRSRGLPPKLGLARCSVLLRRHTAAVENFNNLWWSEYCRHSVRDQISFMYAVYRSGLRVNLIEMSIYDHPAFHLRRRLAEAEPRPAGSPAPAAEIPDLLPAPAE